MTGTSREEKPQAWRSHAGQPGFTYGSKPSPHADTAAHRRSNVDKKLGPDQKGALRLAERFGDSLLCVRYRSDPESGRRFTTVEIVIEERKPSARAPVQQLVRIGWKETELREAIKASGGTWVPEKKLWRAPTRTIRQLRIQNRVVKESA